MKILQEQYNLIKEGKGSKQHFMKLAHYNFPELITPVLAYTDAVTILKNKSILSEGIGGLVTTGKKQDWHAIFNENMTNIKEEKEAKAEEKETTKEVTDMATRGYDYKDKKNYDNVFGQEFLQGYYTEMKDPKNADKHVEELRAIVAKNLAKDISHYVKDGQFGIKGVGYTTEAPGLGEPKEPKGKFKSSGYGDLKESVLRLAIQDIIKEVLIEEEFKAGDYVKYDGKAYRVKAYYKMSDKYDLEDSEDDKKILKNIPANKVSKTAVKEALDKDSIKQEGEDAKKNTMKRRITNEIVRRKKKMKALQTLTELDGEENDNHVKKVKEIQSEIKQLEGMAAKLDSKKKEKKAIEEEVPQMKNIEDEEAKKEVELANILAKKANLLKQPGTQS